MEILMLSHLPTRVLEEGFIPAALDLDLRMTILTDCIREHLLQAKDKPQYPQCRLIECDIFNPLSVARLISVHNLEFSGVLAAGPGLQACAALIADYLGLPGQPWRSALLCEQKPSLRDRLEPESARPYRRIVNCAETDLEIDAELFPVTVEALEADSFAARRIVRNPHELKHCLAEIESGYALIEAYSDGEIYALDGLGTPDGFIVLGGGRIQFDDDGPLARRVQSFTPRPPGCDRVLALISELDLGLGRHHVEYMLSDKGLRIREIHNGLHDDESELAVNAQWESDLFRAIIQVCLGIPITPPKRMVRVPAGRPSLEGVA